MITVISWPVALLVVQMLTDSIGNPITRSEMQAMVTEVVELRLQEVVIVMDRLVRRMR